VVVSDFYKGREDCLNQVGNPGYISIPNTVEKNRNWGLQEARWRVFVVGPQQGLIIALGNWILCFISRTPILNFRGGRCPLSTGGREASWFYLWPDPRDPHLGPRTPRFGSASLRNRFPHLLYQIERPRAAWLPIQNNDRLRSDPLHLGHQKVPSRRRPAALPCQARRQCQSGGHLGCHHRRHRALRGGAAPRWGGKQGSARGHC
jgi:hypothetical protein